MAANDQRDTAEEHDGIAVGRQDVAADGATTSARPMPTGKATASPAISMAANEQEVRNVEENAADEREDDVRAVYLLEIGEKWRALAAHASEREAPEQGPGN